MKYFANVAKILVITPLNSNSLFFNAEPDMYPVIFGLASLILFHLDGDIMHPGLLVPSSAVLP